MRISHSNNTPMLRLSNNQDVVAIVNAIEQDWRYLKVAAVILRTFAGKNPDGLPQALRGARRTLRGLLQGSVPPSEVNARLDEFVAAFHNLYANARDDKDADKRRAKVLELLVYRLIAPAYTAGVCLMNCVVNARNNPRHPITHQEVDVCAWDNVSSFGEAYECAIKPHGLMLGDCTNLLAITKECRGYAEWFRVGVVSLESRDMLERRLDWLLEGQPNQSEFDCVQAFGWDNLTELSA